MTPHSPIQHNQPGLTHDTKLLTWQVNASIGLIAVTAGAAHIKCTPNLIPYHRQRFNSVVVQVQVSKGGALRGQAVACNVLVGPVDDKKQPEELVAALGEDVLPHELVDDLLAAPVRLHQQQVRGGCFCCQGCRHTEGALQS